MRFVQEEDNQRMVVNIVCISAAVNGAAQREHGQRFRHLEAVLCAQDLCKLSVNCELLAKWTDEPAVSLNQ
jgi:hypothetical protein